MTGRHWHVLGAGAIGGLFAAGLQGGGCAVTLIQREHCSATALWTIENGEDSRELDFRMSAAGERSPIRHLLVTTKAYDVLPAVTGIAHRLDERSQVLLMSNGMGFAAELAARFPWLILYCGTTTEGAYRSSPRRIVHAGMGITRLGREGREQPPEWFTDWREATGNCHWEPLIQEALWEKLAINCAINPLTALYRCRNGELASRPELAREVDALCVEIAEISEAAGFARTATGLRERVAEVICGTAQNRSSMLQDRLRGRPTEIDYINGHLLRVASETGVQAPRNRALLQELKRVVA